MSDIRSSIDQSLYDIVMEHLAKLADYLPGPLKKAGGMRSQLLERYREDPVYSIFGLDSSEYRGAWTAKNLAFEWTELDAVFVPGSRVLM